MQFLVTNILYVQLEIVIIKGSHGIFVLVTAGASVHSRTSANQA